MTRPLSTINYAKHYRRINLGRNTIFIYLIYPTVQWRTSGGGGGARDSIFLYIFSLYERYNVPLFSHPSPKNAVFAPSIPEGRGIYKPPSPWRNPVSAPIIYSKGVGTRVPPNKKRASSFYLIFFLFTIYKMIIMKGIQRFFEIFYYFSFIDISLILENFTPKPQGEC